MAGAFAGACAGMGCCFGAMLVVRAAGWLPVAGCCAGASGWPADEGAGDAAGAPVFVAAGAEVLSDSGICASAVWSPVAGVASRPSITVLW
ncbi:hypothetical protein CMsap09_06885 [Clavibacter michiganensis]|uniref:Secreted protein n=1 Tax=Clavibacter michiganensis TaxID=28447 RepID=A0A251XSV2_9MICO|nr:hypothetical protein CMsap09_06885 [Clavibacter michiganensis]